MKIQQPSLYEIRIKGRLAPERAAWFSDLTVSVEDTGNTLLRGAFQDQAALHGVLAQIRDLGLTLLKVEAIL
jgi:hypothetical protein